MADDGDTTQRLLERPASLDSDAGRKAKGKVDVNVLPFVFLAVFVVHIDRASFVLEGHDICDDLKINDAQFKAGNLLFFLGLLLFQIPSNMIMERVHAGRYIASLTFLWGAVALLSILAKKAVFFYVAKFVLGAVEAGILPGLWYYCTMFYPEHDLVVPFTVIEVGRFSAMILAVPFSGFILDIGGALHGWQWTLLFEGCVAVVIGAILFFIMPGGLTDCYFLNIKEARWIQSRIRGADAPQRTRSVKGRQRFVQEWRGMLLSGGLWACAVVMEGAKMVDHLLYVWAPALMGSYKENSFKNAQPDVVSCGGSHGKQGYGEGVTNAWLVAAIPYGIAFFAAFAIAVTAHKSKERKHHVSWPLFGAGVALWISVLVSLSKSGIALSVFLSIAIIGTLVAEGPIVSMASSFLSLDQKAPGFAVFGIIQQLGGYVGVLVTNSLISDHRTFVIPLIFLGIVLVIVSMIILVLPDPARMKRKPILPASAFMDDFQGSARKQEPLEDGQPNRPIVPSVPSMPVVAQPEQGDPVLVTIAYPFDGEAEGELSVQAGDVVQVMSQEADGWVCVRRGEQEGIIPVGYIQDNE